MSETKRDPEPSSETRAAAAAPTTVNENEATTSKDTNASGSTYTEMASNAATGVAGSATTAAVGVKDSVFSMFGGGAKKEKAPEEGEPDRSGSSKAKKDSEAAQKEEAGEEGVGQFALTFPTQ